jgi:RNA-directed DNA polymerase
LLSQRNDLAKALRRERDKLRKRICSEVCFKPLAQLIEDLNGHLRGWANYFGYGYRRKGYREINRYVGQRLTQHVRRRSLRPFRVPEGVSYHEKFKRMGLVYL